MSHPFIGIDLGTTNSVISLAQIRGNGTVSASAISISRVIQPIPNVSGKTSYSTASKYTLPSCVAYDEDRIHVGDYAKSLYNKFPERVAKSIKSQMGNPLTRDLAPDVPDKTPEDVSARILAHLRLYAQQSSQTNHQSIKHAIITVPANFDTARREATMRAAEKAGFSVRENDGSWKPILLSEPNAVLYDLVQQILNGDILSETLDLSSKKRVLVYDIGGGTLDVTFHELELDEVNKTTLNISEIAASRFTQLAGDDFDALVAEHLYKRCIEKFRIHEPAAAQRIQTRAPLVKKMLTAAAEDLKTRMSDFESYSAATFEDDAWLFGALPVADSAEPSYDISHPICDERYYNDTITKAEYEEMVRPLMGESYRFEDYKRYNPSDKKAGKNIILPVLDVLKKAAHYYACRGEELSVDAVVLNGGMAKMYLVRNRIKEFFGIEPLTPINPDHSVANGAAIFAALTDRYNLTNKICIKRHIQNHDIYLGLSAGANDQLIAAGQELPFTATFEGYRLQPQTDSVELPIKLGEEDGEEPRTIARSRITFKNKYSRETNLKIEASFDQTGLLTLNVFLQADNGRVLEKSSVEMLLGSPMAKNSGGCRIIPKTGSRLVASNEIDALCSLFTVRNRNGNKHVLISRRMENILNCQNPTDFEEVVLRHLSRSNDPSFRQKLYEIASAFHTVWSAEGVASLRQLCNRDMIRIGSGYNIDERRRVLSDMAIALHASLT